MEPSAFASGRLTGYVLSATTRAARELNEGGSRRGLTFQEARERPMQNAQGLGGFFASSSEPET